MTIRAARVTDPAGMVRVNAPDIVVDGTPCSAEADTDIINDNVLDGCFGAALREELRNAYLPDADAAEVLEWQAERDANVVVFWAYASLTCGRLTLPAGQAVYVGREGGDPLLRINGCTYVHTASAARPPAGDRTGAGSPRVSASPSPSPDVPRNGRAVAGTALTTGGAYVLDRNRSRGVCRATSISVATTSSPYGDWMVDIRTTDVVMDGVACAARGNANVYFVACWGNALAWEASDQPSVMAWQRRDPSLVYAPVNLDLRCGPVTLTFDDTLLFGILDGQRVLRLDDCLYVHAGMRSTAVAQPAAASPPTEADGRAGAQSDDDRDGVSDADVVPTAGGSVAECFPADATVQLAGGGTRRMDALRVGDVVRTGGGGDGGGAAGVAVTAAAAAGAVAPVYAFSHADPAGVAAYVTLSTAVGALRLSAGHYVPVAPAGCAGRPAAGLAGGGHRCAATAGRLVAAAAVAVGDALLHLPPLAGQAGALGGVAPNCSATPATPAGAAGGVWTPVTRVRVAAAAVAGGLYAPHTAPGTVVVDGFLASVYTTAVAPTVAAAALAPARAAAAVGWGGVVGGRWLPTIGGWAAVPSFLAGRAAY